MKKLMFFLGAFLSLGCPQEDSPVVPPKTPIQITVVDATCTETILKITLDENEQNRIVTLHRNDSMLTTINMVTKDSIIIDDELQPSKNYTYRLLSSGFSVNVQATTMDTTSYIWSYSTETFGDASSYLLDAVIINDTLAYAVGEIHVGDSIYNAVKWNGEKWELMRIMFYTICGQDYRTPYPASSIIAFGPNDVWFAMNGSQIARWNGEQQTETICLPTSFSISKLWGENPQSIYAVGSDGTILYYNGTEWRKMTSGTNQYLVDMKGEKNGLFISGALRAEARGIILRKENEQWKTLIEGYASVNNDELFITKLSGATEGIWIDEKGTLYTVGNLMYRYWHGRWNYMKSLPNNFLGGSNFYRGYLLDVTGNGSNDMIIAGQRNTLRHFNGNTWNEIGIPYNFNSLISWYNVTMRNDIVIGVGLINRQAMVIVLRR
ncbi:MAG: hypothetical protein ACYC09_11275 [Bacteroidota bacterium]